MKKKNWVWLFILAPLVIAVAVAWAADTKITGLTADTSPTSDDLVVTVNAPGSSPANRKVTLANLATFMWASPTLVTPILGAATGTSLALGADPADAGAIRLSSGDAIEWEASPAGVDVVGMVVAGTQVIAIGPTGATAVTITPNTTITGTLSAGAAGFTVDADGDTVAKSVSVTAAAATGGILDLLEGSDNGTSYLRVQANASMATTSGITFSSDVTTESFSVTLGATGSDAVTFASATGAGFTFTPNTTFSGTVGAGATTVTTLNGHTFTTGSSTFTGTAGQTYTFPTTTASIARTDAAQTFTGVQTMTAPAITNAEVDGSTALSLTAAQVSGTTINNTGQGVNDVSHTLPVAAAGYSFIGFVGESQAAKYWRFTANTSPTPDDFMCLDGTCGKTYVSVAAPTQGDTITCWTGKFASTGIKTGAALAIGSTVTRIANGAFTFDISGTGYSKAADAVGKAPGVATTVQNKYGAQALDIGADGTIDAVPGTNITTGFDTPAEAAADLPAVAASHTRMGYVTAMRTDVAGFIWGTTGFNDGSSTVAFTSSTAYTKPYNWICITGKGTWTTN